MCWGKNDKGQLGSGTGDSNVPVAVPGLGTTVSTLAAGEKFTCALMSNGTVLCWGENDKGQLGDGTTTDSTTPVAVAGLSSGAMAIGAGYKHSCAVLTSGTVQCWGHNNHGQLGDGTTGDSAVPVAVSGLTNADSVIGGIEHSCALTSGGSMRCWGRNDKGQLGDGTGNDSPIPVAVNGLPFGARFIAAGEKHTCSVSVLWIAHCWGHNNKGQLGNGSTADSSIPVQILLPADFLAPAAGKEFTCSWRQNDNISCWGNNNAGQLGDGSSSDSPVPVDVTGF
jgi:alpha-tubulin suppressor-like RCC1 family protein